MTLLPIDELNRLHQERVWNLGVEHIDSFNQFHPNVADSQTRRLAERLFPVGVMIITLLTGCSKEPNATPTSPELYNPTSRIVAFLERVEESRSNQDKTNHVLTADSAIWYLEAALNFSFGDVAKPCNEHRSDSLVIPISLSNTTVPGSTVYSAFDELAVLIVQINTEEQHVSVVDVVEPLAGAQELLVYLTIGSGYDKGAPINNYDSKSYFYFLGAAASTACHCQPPPQVPQVVFCANKQIEQRINAANTIGLGGTQFVTDVETWKVWTFTDIPGRKIMPLELELTGPLPYQGGYHASKSFTWRQGATPGGTCLDPSEMTYWTGNSSQGTWGAITSIRAARCPTKTFLSCHVG